MSQADDVENTFRALKDSPLIATRIGCRFGLHKWTKWDTPFILKLFRTDEYMQGRVCTACNTSQTREIKRSEFEYLKILANN